LRPTRTCAIEKVQPPRMKLICTFVLNFFIFILF